MQEPDPAALAAAAAAAEAASSSSSSSRAVAPGGGGGNSYHGNSYHGYPTSFGHSSLYASLLGSMSGHQLGGSTHHLLQPMHSTGVTPRHSNHRAPALSPEPRAPSPEP